jgi:Short C-terminal domain
LTSRAREAVDIGEMQRTAERVQRITSQGVDGKATVISARELGEGMGGVGVAVELQLNLISGPGAPRTLTIRQDVMGGADSYTPGLELPLKVDPQHPDDAMIWADVDPATRNAAAAASGVDRTAHLDALAQLRDRGQLSEQEFQEAKARIVGEA